MGMKRLAIWQFALVLLLSAIGSALMAAPKADPEPFFQRLESIGLQTATVRKLAAKVTIIYREPNDTKEAEYGYIRKRLYIPTELKEERSNRMKFDMSTTNINTLIHELQHAYDFLMVDKDAPAGSDEKLAYEARNSIWADLMLNPQEGFLGIARYPRTKSFEIAGYYMGDVIGDIFQTVDTLVVFNEKMAKAYIKKKGDAERYGDRFILPPEELTSGFFQNLRATKLSAANMSAAAYFDGKVVKWPENRYWVKQQLYDHSLGLHPPRGLVELIEQLNTLDNEWVQGVRARIKTARLKAEKELPVERPEAPPALDDLRNR